MAIKMIVGLGNPGPEYELTRHNAGFWFVDNLQSRYGGNWRKEAKFQAIVCKTNIGGSEVWLVKPQTFMNESGRSVGAIARFYKIEPDEVLVVHDELDIVPGHAKLKRSGSTGGHNGLKDVSRALGTQQFWRLRFGIGHPRELGLKTNVVDFVLHKPSAGDMGLIEEALFRGIDVTADVCAGEFEKAMMALHSGNK